MFKKLKPKCKQKDKAQKTGTIADLEAKDKSILYTDNIKTETKARINTCKFKDRNIEFSCEDIEDNYY